MKRSAGIVEEPEFALFLFLVALMAWVAVGLLYRLYIQYGLGLTVTSWWRSPWRNEEVGGVYNSLHMAGLAWDVVPVTQENADKLRGIGLRVIDERDHLHAQIL